MTKLLGAMLVLFAGTMIGLYKSQQYARRPQQIRQLILALQRLETEIAYGFTPLPEALVHVAAPLSAPLAAMFRLAAQLLDERSGLTTAESWRRAIADSWMNTSMKAGEREVIERLGATLGLTDQNDQVKHLRLAVNHLQAEEQSAWEERKRYSGMWRSLGVLGGALLVILMF